MGQISSMAFPPCGHNFNHIIAHLGEIVKRIMVFSAVFRRERLWPFRSTAPPIQKSSGEFVLSANSPESGSFNWFPLRNGHNRSLHGFSLTGAVWHGKTPSRFSGGRNAYSCSMSCFRVMPSKKSSIIRPSLVHMARLWQLRSQAASQLTGLKLPSVSRRISPTV